MIKNVKYKDEPELFVDIQEFEIDRIQEHRRGSNFWTELIIELKPEHKKYFEGVEDFDKYVGTWITNQVIWDDNYGTDEPYSELTRVEKVEKITYEWQQV